MTEKISGSAIAPGTITVTQISGSFNETSNASYAQANVARNQANNAYAQANAAQSTAQNSYSQANSAYSTANNSGFGSGTIMLFVQTAAPTGWTKSTTHNDKALRVVSGSVSTGGSVAFTSAFASQSVAGSISSTTQGGSVSTSVSGSVSGSVGSTTLSTSEMPSHGHSVTDNGVGVTVYDSSVAGGGPYGTVARAATQSAGAGLTINSTGGGGSHNHSWSGSFSGSASSTFTGSSHGHTFTGTAINLAVQYVDVIIATKN